jgi:hypothetical protein
LLLVGCSPPRQDPVADVRAIVEALVASVDEREPRAILEHLAFDFRSEDGLSYPDVQSIVLEYLMGAEIPSARLESSEIVPGGEPDVVRVHARLRFARGTSPAALYDFEVLFQQRGGLWRAQWADYRRVEAPASPSSSGGPSTTPRHPATSTSVPGRASSERT